MFVFGSVTLHITGFGPTLYSEGFPFTTTFQGHVGPESLGERSKLQNFPKNKKIDLVA